MSEYEQIVPASYPQRHPHAFVAPHTGGMDEGLDSCRAEREDNMRCLWPRAHHRWPCSPTCTHDDAWTPGHPERVKERSEALEACAHDPKGGPCDDCVTSVRSDDDDQDAESEAYDRGADDMRSACIVAVDVVAAREGLSTAQRAALQAAIEGATP